MEIPSITERKARLQKTLATIQAENHEFDITNKTELLTTISRLTVELCEHIETLTYDRHDAIATVIAQIEVKETATLITSLCLKEIRDDYQRDAIAAISAHMRASRDPDNTLCRMDLPIGTEIRVSHLVGSLGDLATYWYAQPDQANEYIMREDAIISVAYRSACTLIAANHTLIVN
jgi:hypothetical protein